MKWIAGPHHLQALDHLAKHERAALFLEMSLNKTSITLTHWHRLTYEELEISRALVIAPDKVARFTWIDEINKWDHLQGSRISVIAGTPKQREKALAQDAELYTIGIDNLAWLLGKLGGSLRSFDLVILDELSLFKSTNSQRFRKLRKAIKPVQRRIGLTGTPAPNGYVDLWAQVVLLDDGRALGDSVVEYRSKYFTERGRDNIVFEYIPRPGALKEIAHRLRSLALTMQTKDHAKLPPARILDVPVELGPEGRRAYDTLEGDMVLELEREVFAWDHLIGEPMPWAVYAKTAADLGIKLQQLSGGALYETDTREVLEIHNDKLEVLDEILARHETVLLVYQFQHEVDRIQARHPHARKLRKPSDLVEWNKGAIPLLMIHPASAGHGLNLQTGGNVIVWFSMTWNLEHYQQTNARLVRMGQPADEVLIYRLIAKGTRDGKIAKRLEGKGTTQKGLMDDIKELRTKWQKRN